MLVAELPLLTGRSPLRRAGAQTRCNLGLPTTILAWGAMLTPPVVRCRCGAVTTTSSLAATPKVCLWVRLCDTSEACDETKGAGRGDAVLREPELERVTNQVQTMAAKSNLLLAMSFSKSENSKEVEVRCIPEVGGARVFLIRTVGIPSGTGISPS